MSHGDFVLVLVHLTGLLVGWWIGYQGRWLAAYKAGMSDSRAIWERAHNEAHATLIMSVHEERAQLVATLREQIKRASESNGTPGEERR